MEGPRPTITDDSMSPKFVVNGFHRRIELKDSVFDCNGEGGKHRAVRSAYHCNREDDSKNEHQSLRMGGTPMLRQSLHRRQDSRGVQALVADLLPQAAAAFFVYADVVVFAFEAGLQKVRSESAAQAGFYVPAFGH
jgi:hypothetical protein